VTNLTLRVHQRITLEARGRDGNLCAGATVRELHDDRVVVVPAPGAPSLEGLAPGDLVDVLVANPKGALRGEARVLAVGPALTITPPVETSSLRRRRFFRVRVAVPFSFIVIQLDGAPGTPLGVRARTLDLSGGGLKLESELGLALDAHLQLILHLPGDPVPVTTEGRVAWGERARPQSRQRFCYGVEFTDLSKEDRDRVICFLLGWRGRAAVK
jgi:Tfp pilus assembly protein PilZ